MNFKRGFETIMSKHGKYGRYAWKKKVSVLLSAALTVGSLTFTDGLSVNATTLPDTNQTNETGTVSDGDAITDETVDADVDGTDATEEEITTADLEAEDTVSANDIETDALLASNALSLLSLAVDDATSYEEFTEDKLIYSFAFGTDITSASTYGNDAAATAAFGFRDVEYATAAKGWDGGVYYSREKSKDEVGASYVENADGALKISSKVWTETESTGYGVYTYENTSEFSMDLANADYTVSVTFTNPTSSDYSAYIESEEITKVDAFTVSAGASKTVSYTAVLVDGRLDIKFLGSSSATEESAAATQAVYVSKVEVTRLKTNDTENKPTVFIASDSTVQTYDEYYYPQTGWGQVLHSFFGEFVEERECDDCNYSQAQTYETENVIVENRAIGGRSSSSFVLEGKLDDLLEDVKPGDFVLIQWGHNDATSSRPNRYVASSDFEEWIQYYIDGTVQRGATPILVTPVARYSYKADDDGNLVTYLSNFEAYRQVMIKMSKEQGVALVDLTQRSIDLANSFGIEGGKSLWLHVTAGDYSTGAYTGGTSDSTHLQYYGAYKFAQCVAKGIKEASDDSTSYEAEKNVNDKNKNALKALAAYVTLNEADSAPGAVTGLETTTVGSSSVSMKWTADDASEMYYIYRAVLESGQSADDVTFDADEKYSVTSSTKYTDSSCEAGVTYVYVVAGFNDKGVGELSEKITVTTKDAGWKFDFNVNNSPTLDGWTGVSLTDMYSDEKGYGWITAPTQGRDRGEVASVPDSTGELGYMGRDFVLGDTVFEVEVPNGDYEVTCYAADLIAGGSTIKSTFTGEGKTIGQVAAKQSIGKVTATVRVTDGRLTIGNNGYMTGITITEISKAPSSLTATESKVEGSKMQFLLGFVGTDNAASYKVYCKGASDADYSVIKSFTVEKYAEAELDCKQQSANLGETFEYYMTAVLTDGTETARSEILTVETVLKGVPVTESPTNVICVDPTESTTTLQHTITISWDAVEATIGTSEADESNQGKSFGAIAYNIYRSAKAEDEKGFKEFVKIGTSTTTSFTDTDSDIATNISYYYKVTAVNAGGESEMSEACKTPVAGVLVPGTLETYSDRALVAVRLSDSVTAIDTDGTEIKDGVYLSWRAFEADMDSNSNLATTFTVYVNDSAVVSAKNLSVTNLVLTDVPENATFKVVGSNDEAQGLTARETKAWDNQYLEMSLNKPADQTMPDGSVATYTANDMSVGDVDGDGILELIVKWYPSNAKDNSGSGYTGTTILDTYDIDYNSGKATLLSRIDLGVNIRSGAHYTQFQVWDFDGDGKAEVAIKTADGTTSYDGNMSEVAYVGACNAAALPTDTVSSSNDYRNTSGYILDGPEYFSIFNLEDGTKAADDVEYLPGRGTVSAWGDAYGNRVDRFLSATAYLDGEHAFAVMCRGYYTRTALTAYGMKDTDDDGVSDTIYTYWTYDTDDYDGANEGQGNHNLAVADVDNDGKDEIVYGASCYDHDGTLKYTTGLGHGDAMHVSDWIDWNDGLEVMEVHEEHNQTYQVEIHDAETGEILIGYPVANQDVGRGVAADIDPTSLGAEFWASKAPDASGTGEWDSVDSAVLGTENSSTSSWDYLSYGSTPAVNAMIYWDGDLLAEIQDHTFNSTAYAPLSVVIADWDYENSKQVTLIDSSEVLSSNGTKGNLGLIADLVGDWREEFIARCSSDDSKIRLYTTTYVTDYVIPCLLEDLQYREGVAWENVAYNQPTHLSYSISKGLVTSQLSEGDTQSDSAEILFTAANDGDIYGHEITAYEIYRAGSDGVFEKIDTIDVDDLKKAGASASEEEAEEVEEIEQPTQVDLNFDFGAAYAADGWTQVTASTEYSEAIGYGFTDTSVLSNKVYKTWTSDENAYIYNDCVLGWIKNGSEEFKVDIPNGTYEVTYYIANGSGTVYNLITAEDVTFTDVRRGKSEIICTYETKEVTVADGQLNIVNTVSKDGQLGIYFTAISIKETDDSYAARYAEYEAAKKAQESEQGTEDEVRYVYTDNAVASNTTYSYKIAAVVDGHTSYMSRALEVTTAIAITSVEELEAASIVENTPLEDGETAAKFLPATVKVVDEDGNSHDYDVTWDVSTLDITTVGTYTVTGTLKGYSEKISLTVNVVANEIKGYAEIDPIQVIKDTEATLPTTVEVEYTNTTKETVNVTWDTSKLDTTTVGEYELKGTLESEVSGLSKKPTLTVKVVDNYIASVAKTYCELTVNTESASSDMPATVTATWAKGNTSEEEVTWDLSEVKTDTVGTYTATGTVEGFTGEVVASVSVNYKKVYAFDFGINASESADGYTTITVNAKGGKKTADELGITYSEEAGYGFLDGTAVIEGRSESYTQEGLIPSNVYKDFALPAKQTFVADVANGTYQVDIFSGSAYKSNVKGTVEGTSFNISNTAGTYTIGSVTVEVTDGQITLVFDSSTTSRLDAIVIRLVSETKEEPETPETPATPDPGDTEGGSTTGGSTTEEGTTTGDSSSTGGTTTDDSSSAASDSSSNNDSSSDDSSDTTDTTGTTNATAENNVTLPGMDATLEQILRNAEDIVGGAATEIPDFETPTTATIDNEVATEDGITPTTDGGIEIETGNGYSFRWQVMAVVILVIALAGLGAGISYSVRKKNGDDEL